MSFTQTHFPHAGISHYQAHLSKLKRQPQDIPVAWTPHSAQMSSLSSLMSLFCPSIPSRPHSRCNPWIPSLSSHICGHLNLSSFSRTFADGIEECPYLCLAYTIVINIKCCTVFSLWTF